MPSNLILLSEQDNVGVAIRDIEPGTQVGVNDYQLVSRDTVPLGHKMALRQIEMGQKIIKFGVPVGSATQVIPAGAHVHIHNVKSDYLTNVIDHFE